MGIELDSTKVDPDHYQVAFEDERVRVVTANYGPGEESPMHSHPQQIVVFLSDAELAFTGPDGNTEKIVARAGDAVPLPPTTHQAVNMANQPARAVLVELKG